MPMKQHQRSGCGIGIDGQDIMVAQVPGAATTLHRHHRWTESILTSWDRGARKAKASEMALALKTIKRASGLKKAMSH